MDKVCRFQDTVNSEKGIGARGDDDNPETGELSFPKNVTL